MYKVLYVSNNEKCISYLRTIHQAIQEAEYMSKKCHIACIINSTAGNSFACMFKDGIEKETTFPEEFLKKFKKL